MKKIVLLSSMSLVLSACSQQTVAPQKQDVNVNVNVDMNAAAKVENANNSVVAPKNSNNLPTSAGNTLGTLSPVQSVNLAGGMEMFGVNMSQHPYIKTDVPLSLTWESGGVVSGYTIYESYIYKSGGTTHRYFFVTNPTGGTEVLYSTGGTVVRPTSNADIREIFKNAFINSGGSTTPVLTNNRASLFPEQSEKLAREMEEFGRNMGQYPYVRTDVPATLTWQSGAELSGYTVLESYIYQSGTTTHRYFFALNPSGETEVLYSTGGTNVKKTENADIVEIFARVYRG